MLQHCPQVPRGGTWSMLSGINSPSLLMLVKEPFLATCCSASGIYPGGGELRSVEWEPERWEQIFTPLKWQLSLSWPWWGKGPLFTYQSQHAFLVCHPESGVVQVLVRRQQVHTGGRVLEETHFSGTLQVSRCSASMRQLNLLTWDRFWSTRRIFRLFMWTLRSSSSTALSRSSWVVNGITNCKKNKEKIFNV